VSVTAIANWGPLVIGTDVDDAVISTMQKWAPTYLKQAKLARNLSYTPAMYRTYANTFAGQEFLDHQLPALVAVTAQATATRGGRNMPYEATWTTRVATVVRGKRPAATRFLASLYEGVQRQVILQKVCANPADGPANSVHWQGTAYELVPDGTGQGRYLLAATSVLQVFTDMAVQPYAGPETPDATTYIDEATVVEVDIKVLGSQMPPITSGP
jgi:hypothetical protein